MSKCLYVCESTDFGNALLQSFVSPGGKCLIALRISVLSAFPSLVRVISSFLKHNFLCKVTRDPKCNFKGKIIIVGGLGIFFFPILTVRLVSICCPSVAFVKINKQKAKIKIPILKCHRYLSYTFPELKRKKLKCGETQTCKFKLPTLLQILCLLVSVQKLVSLSVPL